jgi:hypothetical protein
MKRSTYHNHASPAMLQSVGYIAIVAGTIEHYLEDILVNITGENVANKQPTTDMQPVSKRIDRFRNLRAAAPSPEMREAIGIWCDAAMLGFECRNSILHGVACFYSDGNFDFITNTGYRQELRKRQAKSFIANDHTTNLLAEAFAVLIATITDFMLFFGGRINESELNTRISVADIRKAFSTTRELANLAAAYNSEKY